MKKRNRYTRRQRAVAASMMVILTVSSTMGPGLAFGAGFVDDWIAQKSTSGSTAYQGAQRGYYSGGSFSTRMRSSNDNLVSISTPSLKIGGCGGISAFTGGVSFLNVDYLVQKLQNVLAQAPAAAFDIALKTLAPQVSETIKTLTSMADKLNGLQMDDCKSSKAMVATLFNEGPWSNEATQKEATTAQADFMQTSGANDFYTGLKKDWGALQKTWAGNPPPTATNPISDAAKAAISGCPADIISVFGTSGSLLANLATQKGIPADYVPILRGFIGDVKISTSDDTKSIYNAVYVPACDENKGLLPFLDGTAVQRTSVDDSACSVVADANKNLNLFVSSQMASIAGKMKTKTDLLPAEKAFLESMPLPISITLKNAVASKTEAQVIGKLSDITAKAYAYYMLNNLFGTAIQMHAQAKHIMSAQKDQAAGQDREKCNMTIFQPAVGKLETVEKNTLAVMAAARESYADSLSESQAIETFVYNMARFRDQVQQEVSQQFGAAVARRSTGG